MFTSFKNAHDQDVVFTHQDQDLLEAFHKVKRFLIKDVKGLQGLVINVRGTPALENCWVEALYINGRPRVKKGKFVSKGTLIFKNCVTCAPNLPDKYRKNDVYVDTLITYHVCFKYNSKVKAFLEKLRQADRFQQHCIINNVQYTLYNFEAYLQAVLFDMQISEWTSDRD